MVDHPQEKKHPVQSHRDGAVEVAIWRRETDTGPVFNTERTRSYRDQDGNWQKTHAIPERDLLKAARLDQRAYESIQQMRNQDRAKYIEQEKASRNEQAHEPSRAR